MRFLECICTVQLLFLLAAKGLRGEDPTPVCATNSASIQLFGNQQIMEESPDFVRIALHYCLPDCNLGCPTRYRPVCGYDPDSQSMRNFINNCQMSKVACKTKVDWTLYKDEECKLHEMGLGNGRNTTTLAQQSLEKKRYNTALKRPVHCTDIYNPVCAVYAGVTSTFSNECMVNAENVITGKDWQIFSKGVCPEDYATQQGHISLLKRMPRRTRTKRSP